MIKVCRNNRARSKHWPQPGRPLSSCPRAHGLNVGFLGPFWAMQAAFPSMKANGWGRVVNMCSLNGVNAHMGSLEYNTSKEALRTLTRTAARLREPHAGQG